MKKRQTITFYAALGCTIVTNISSAASFPLIEDFEDSPLGTDAPIGWLQGPPAGTKSIGIPWSVAEGGDWGQVYKFSGPDQFDGIGRAYATVEVGDVPFGDGANWRCSVDFKLIEFLMDGPTDSFNFGLGLMGQHALFTSPGGGGFGANDYYLVDWGFTLPEEIQQLDAVPMTYRFIEFGALGAVDIGFYSQHIEAGFFNTSDSFRMVVEGRYSGTDLNLVSWVENLTQEISTEPVTAVAPNPIAGGRHFGFRFASAGGITTVGPAGFNKLGELNMHLDNFRLTDVDYVDPQPETFWNSMADAEDGWKNDWLGFVRPEGDPYAYHMGLKWIYSTSADSSSTWIYMTENTDFGWFWTSDAYYPYIYSPMDGWCLLLDSQGATPVILVIETGEQKLAVPQG